jgi:hypothetical protein
MIQGEFVPEKEDTIIEGGGCGMGYPLCSPGVTFVVPVRIDRYPGLLSAEQRSGQEKYQQEAGSFHGFVVYSDEI